MRSEGQDGKRGFGLFEAVFDIAYLLLAMGLGIYMLIRGGSGAAYLAGAMAIVLAGGDMFHLVPRIRLIAANSRGDGAEAEKRLAKALGWGKLITSITMTVYYILLWQLGQMLFPSEGALTWGIAVYVLAALRVVLSLLPQNAWGENGNGLRMSVIRNVPFFAIGAIVAVYFAIHAAGAFGLMWLAILVSFGCYAPVLFWVEKHPALGMLMLPKTCAYIWMLFMCAAAVA